MGGRTIEIDLRMSRSSTDGSSFSAVPEDVQWRKNKKKKLPTKLIKKKERKKDKNLPTIECKKLWMKFSLSVSLLEG